MKRLLIIPHTFSHGGGAERVLNTLIGELAKWYEIDLIERWEDNTYVYELPPNVHKLKSMTYYQNIVEEKGLNKYYWKCHRIILSALTIFFPSMVYRHYIKGEYDYEISFNYLYSALLIANSPNKESKKISWNHGDLYSLEYKKYKGLQRLRQWIKYNTEKRALKKIDLVIAISQNTYNSIAQLFPFTLKKLRIVPNGYNFHQIILRSKDENPQKTLRFRLISLGRLDPNKNVISQVRAVNKIIETGKVEVELHIFGIGEELSTIEKEAGENLNRYIFVRGYSNNPYPHLKKSDALLMTSYSEGFPTVLIESICLGVPVLTTEVGGVEEIVKDGLNGLIIKQDINDMVEKICYMATHYDQFTNNIQETISQFTAEKWGESVKNLLEKL